MTSPRMPTILLVDDDDAHLLVARRAIARANLGVDLHVARDGSEALRELGLITAAASDSDLPKVVLVMLDLSMPGLNGWDVLARIRQSERSARVPVVVVSTSARQEDVRRSYDLGANSYLVKRFDPGRPGGYVADAARYWIELNEAPAPGARP